MRLEMLPLQRTLLLAIVSRHVVEYFQSKMGQTGPAGSEGADVLLMPLRWKRSLRRFVGHCSRERRRLIRL